MELMGYDFVFIPWLSLACCTSPCFTSIHSFISGIPKGERSQSRAGPVTGTATLTFALETAHLSPWLVSYIQPRLYPAVKVLSMGCVAGMKTGRTPVHT